MNTQQFSQNGPVQGGHPGWSQTPRPPMPPRNGSLAPKKLELLVPPCRPRDLRHPKDKFIAGLLMLSDPMWFYFYVGDVMKGWMFLGVRLVLILFLITALLAVSAAAFLVYALLVIYGLFGLLQAILIWNTSIERWDESYGFRI